MTCRHCQQLLSPHLDNALSIEERQEVLAHLEHCTTCTERFQQLEQGRQLLRVLPVAEVTLDMETRLLEKVRSTESRVQSPHPTLRTLRSAFSVWWSEWRLFSVGTLATAAASVLFYFAMMQAPPKVSAAEVVASMDQLLSTIDAEDGENLIAEETSDGDETQWKDDSEQGLFENEDEKN
jgi:anti-sigma factor RsiW